MLERGEAGKRCGGPRAVQRTGLEQGSGRPGCAWLNRWTKHEHTISTSAIHSGSKAGLQHSPPMRRLWSAQPTHAAPVVSTAALTLTAATRASLRTAPLPTSANLSPAATTTEAASQRLAGAAV